MTRKETTMETIRIRICLGTACHVLGASQFQHLADHLPASLRDRVQIEWTRCLGLCREYSGQDQPPYVMVNDQVVTRASIPSVLACIRTQAGD